MLCFLCVCVCATYVPMDGCEASRGCWELNPGPLQEQKVLLTAEPPRQPLALNCLKEILNVLSTHTLYGDGEMA